MLGDQIKRFLRAVISEKRANLCTCDIYGLLENQIHDALVVGRTGDDGLIYPTQGLLFPDLSAQILSDLLLVTGRLDARLCTSRHTSRIDNSGRSLGARRRQAAQAQ